TPATDDAFAEVKAKVDLVKVVQEHVRLTKRNKDFWGLCPFHQEDSPSFKVNPQMQSWYCFGCERSGDVFTFVELIEKTDKRGALQMLAERAGVELRKLSPDQKERADLRKRALDMLKLAAQYCECVLWKSPAGEPGRRLLESRRVGEETARRFQLGYAPAGRGFAEYLRAKKRSLVDAQEAGLMRRDGTDFFAERLVIPIRDERGQVLAFTARTVRQDEQKKYINSPETPAYIKGRVVFGLDPARFRVRAAPAAAARGEEPGAKAPSGFESGMEEDSVGLNPSNPNQVERVAARLREWIRQFPATLREGYAEAAERHTGISRHM